MSVDVAVGVQAILKTKIETRQARIAVIGLGYVGLPLAAEFGQTGFSVVGIDVNEEKVAQLNRGESYIRDVDSVRLNALVEDLRFTASSSYETLAETDIIIICVPTPLGKTKEPDISYILAAAEAVKSHLHPGQLVILESTTYPGTTDE